jgi:DHA2 family multidrug resistance protein
MLIMRGLGMSMLFIPITMLSLSTLRGKQIGQGASFTGMMRQLGGSFGVALITVLLDRKNQAHRVDLVGNLDPSNPAFQARLHAFQNAFMSKGMPPNVALGQAYQAMNHGVAKQAAVLSYMDAFLYIGILFLLTIPFILMTKSNKAAKVSMSEAMH